MFFLKAPYIWIRVPGKHPKWHILGGILPEDHQYRQDRVVPVARSKFLQKLLQCDLQIMEAYGYTGRWFLGCIMKYPNRLKMFSWWLVCSMCLFEKRLDRPSLKSQY